MSLRLCKRKGSKNWYIRNSVRGITIFESTGTSERSAAEAIRIQREKVLLDESIFGKKTTATFVGVAVSYIEQGGEKKHLIPMVDRMGRMPISAIDQVTADRIALEIYPNAKVSTRVRQFYTPLKAILNHAADRGYCGKPTIKSPSIPRATETRCITSEEAERLIDACAKHLRPLVIFLLYTGARASEAVYLPWRQVDLERSHVDFLKTKNDEPRGMSLHPRVVEALKALPHREGNVFLTDKGKPYARKKDGGGQFKTAFKKACQKAGIEDFTPHGCRHTFATWYQIANHDPIGLMEAGGWKTESMVRRYVHLNVSHLAKSVAALPWPSVK